MLQSHVIEIDGAFVGAAVRRDPGYRFVATDHRLDELHGTIWPSLSDVLRLANRAFRAGGGNAPSPADLAAELPRPAWPRCELVTWERMA